MRVTQLFLLHRIRLTSTRSLLHDALTTLLLMLRSLPVRV